MSIRGLVLGLLTLSVMYGQFPGSGIPFPRRGGQQKKAAEEAEVFKGVLRKMTDAQLWLETDDKRIVRINRSDKTKYLQREEPIKPAAMELGDRVMVDANQGKLGWMAVEVRLTKKGSDEDHARAKANIPKDDDDEASPSSSSATSQNVDRNRDDDDRPTMRRGSQPQQRQREETVAAAATLKGVLRRMDESQLLLEADDKRLVKVNFNDRTRFLQPSIEPGDKLTIDATQDSKGAWTAAEVRLAKRGTPEERAKAKQNVPPGDDDDDKPSPPAPVKAASKEKPAAAPAESDDADKSGTVMAPRAASSSSSSADPDRPRLSRGRPTTTASSKRPADDDDAMAPIDPPPPTVAPRRRPAASAESSSREDRLRREADDERLDRAPSVESTAPDSFLAKARDVANNFSETLPNYTVKQFTTRFQSDNPRVNWQPVDNVSTDVIYEGGKESYKNILVNGKPPKGKVEESGSWSKGEFASVLLDLFHPATAADFTPTGNATVATRSTRVYKFTVEQPNSHWKISSTADSYFPAYKGTVWIDKETARVMRIEMQTRNMPKAFSMDVVEMTLDYEFVTLGGNSYLLPVHSENLACFRGTSSCSKNVIDFRNYRKFGAESTIIFK